jgi:hypothetical protein
MFSVLLCLCALTVTAQKPQNKEFFEKLFNAKVSELAQRLEMSEEQKTKFAPIYRKYMDEMRSLWKAPKGNKKPQGPPSEEERVAFAKRRLEIQQQAQTIRLKYIDEFATVLNSHQIGRLYDVEDQIQRKMMNRYNHRPGQGPGPGPRQEKKDKKE